MKTTVNVRTPAKKKTPVAAAAMSIRFRAHREHRTFTWRMRSRWVRSAFHTPLIPSPGRPKIVSTPQSIRRSSSRSDAVSGMGAAVRLPFARAAGSVGRMTIDEFAGRTASYRHDDDARAGRPRLRRGPYGVERDGGPAAAAHRPLQERRRRGDGRAHRPRAGPGDRRAL